MDLFGFREKSARVFLSIVCLVSLCVMVWGCSSKPTAPALTADQALQKCDELASTPGDPQRALAPVDSDHFAPQLAVAACQSAVKMNPDSARAQFELGRSLWENGKFAEAFEYLKEARLRHYAAASLYLGYAYRDGYLPPDHQASLSAAVPLFWEAEQAGVGGAREAAEDANKVLDSLTFDKNLFQNADLMERLYNGNLTGSALPLSLVSYARGIAEQMDDQSTLFLDQNCKVLLSTVGLTVLKDAGGAIGVVDAIGESKSFSDLFFRALGLIGSSGFDPVTEDQGKRDATILYNDTSGRYGCRSPVTKQILSNIMIMVKVNGGVRVETPFGNTGPILGSNEQTTIRSYSHPPPTLQDQALSIAKLYYDVSSQNTETAVAWLTEHLAENINFYGRSTAKNVVLLQKQQYFNRWSTRRYDIDPSSISVTCDSQRRSCTVTGIVAYRAERLGKASSGTASFVLGINFSSGNDLIDRESSQVLSRH